MEAKVQMTVFPLGIRMVLLCVSIHKYAMIQLMDVGVLCKGDMDIYFKVPI